MIARGFHLWERRLASVDTNRVVRPFEWGLEWLDLHAHEAPGPIAAIGPNSLTPILPEMVVMAEACPRAAPRQAAARISIASFMQASSRVSQE